MITDWLFSDLRRKDNQYILSLFPSHEHVYRRCFDHKAQRKGFPFQFDQEDQAVKDIHKSRVSKIEEEKKRGNLRWRYTIVQKPLVRLGPCQLFQWHSLLYILHRR